MSSSLLGYNTFGLEQFCDELITPDTKELLASTCYDLYHSDKAFLIIGGGSNVVFTDNFAGAIVHVDTKGIEITEHQQHIILDVQAGENWHDLVTFCVDKGFYGIENLALIPGTVGAAPIQNIGAYGVEFCDVCESVTFLDLDAGEVFTIRGQDCQFSYRESIFKQQLKNKSVILEVSIKLSKNWQPNLVYAPLNTLDKATITAKDVFNAVCQVRASKLPDPRELGNVGSFFKNPIVTMQKFNELQLQFPEIVGYTISDNLMKLAAGWLIDNAGLKGKECGGASVHINQALVLVNSNNATGKDVCELALYIIQTIKQRFEVDLEAEPRIIGLVGEIELHE